MRLKSLIAAALCLSSAVPAVAAPAGMTVERVVLLMRHGVRPPTKSPPMPAGVAADAWPSWSVPAGWLTAHGAEAIRLLGRYDRNALAADGVLPATGCPTTGAIAIVSDSDQRTIATGDAYLEGIAPGCRIAHSHRAQGEPDPLFSPIGKGGVPIDPARANAAIAGILPPGGVAAIEKSEGAALRRIDAILCGGAKAGCGVSATPSGITPAATDKRPKLTGALDRGSTVAQILLLEYAEGKPLAEVGWGRATAADIALTGSLHSTEFAILARPDYLAKRNIGPIARRMIEALTSEDAAAAKLTVIVGHDTNVASLGGLLDLHWRVPGFAADDPAPGGAIEIRLLRDAKGARFVQALYRAQSLEQIRALSPLDQARGVATVLPIPACGPRKDACPLAVFERLLTITGPAG